MKAILVKINDGRYVNCWLINDRYHLIDLIGPIVASTLMVGIQIEPTANIKTTTITLN